MPEPHYRIEYDATLEEMIEITVLSTQRTRTHSRARQSGRRNMALLLPVVATVTAITKMGEFFGWTEVGIISLGSVIVLGLPIYFLYGRYYDWLLRDSVTKLTRERYGDAGTPSETEFLDDKLWTKQRHLEVGLPWSSLLEIEEAADEVRLWFIHTVVTFPRRVLKDDEDRKTMIETARALARRSGAPAFALEG